MNRNSNNVTPLPGALILPREKQLSGLPADSHNAFNILAHDEAMAYAILCHEAALPLMVDSANHLFELATTARVHDIAFDLAMAWGQEDTEPDLMHLCWLRCWPQHAGHAFQIRASQPAAHDYKLGPLHVHGRQPEEVVEIHDANGQTVFHSQKRIMRPGVWLGALVTEYAHLNAWEKAFSRDNTLAKPAVPLHPPQP